MSMAMHNLRLCIITVMGNCAQKQKKSHHMPNICCIVSCWTVADKKIVALHSAHQNQVDFEFLALWRDLISTLNNV